MNFEPLAWRPKTPVSISPVETGGAAGALAKLISRSRMAARPGILIIDLPFRHSGEPLVFESSTPG
jgi:hypothetical protein